MVVRIIGGLFVLAHGVVHTLYAAHSYGFFELQSGLRWPEGSWLLSSFAGANSTRIFGAVTCLVAALGFFAAGLAILLRSGWWKPLALLVALFSIGIFFVLWNGKLSSLDGQGGIGVLISAAIVLTIFVLERVGVEG